MRINCECYFSILSIDLLWSWLEFWPIINRDALWWMVVVLDTITAGVAGDPPSRTELLRISFLLIFTVIQSFNSTNSHQKMQVPRCIAAAFWGIYTQSPPTLLVPLSVGPVILSLTLFPDLRPDWSHIIKTALSTHVLCSVLCFHFRSSYRAASHVAEGISPTRLHKWSTLIVDNSNKATAPTMQLSTLLIVTVLFIGTAKLNC